MSWRDYEEDRKWQAVEILRHGPVDCTTGDSGYGKIYPMDVAMLIYQGVAEEFQVNGVTYIRLKDVPAS